MTEIHLNKYQLAKRWGLAPRTIDRWRWEGNGPQHLKIGGRIMYRVIDVEAFETQCLRDSTEKHNGIPLTAVEKSQMGAAP